MKAASQRKSERKRKKEKWALWRQSKQPTNELIEAEKQFASMMLSNDERKRLANLSPETAYVMGQTKLRPIIP